MLKQSLSFVKQLHGFLNNFLLNNINMQNLLIMNIKQILLFFVGYWLSIPIAQAQCCGVSNQHKKRSVCIENDSTKAAFITELNQYDMIVEATVIAESDTIYLNTEGYDIYYNPERPYILQTLKIHRLFKGNISSDTLQILTLYNGATLADKKLGKMNQRSSGSKQVFGYKTGDTGIFMLYNTEENKSVLRQALQGRTNKVKEGTILTPALVKYADQAGMDCTGKPSFNNKRAVFHFTDTRYAFTSVHDLYQTLMSYFPQAIIYEAIDVEAAEQK